MAASAIAEARNGNSFVMELPSHSSRSEGGSTLAAYYDTCGRKRGVFTDSSVGAVEPKGRMRANILPHPLPLHSFPNYQMRFAAEAGLMRVSWDSLFRNLFRKCPSPFAPPSPRGRRTRTSISANLDTSAPGGRGTLSMSLPSLGLTAHVLVEPVDRALPGEFGGRFVVAFGRRIVVEAVNCTGVDISLVWHFVRLQRLIIGRPRFGETRIQGPVVNQDSRLDLGNIRGCGRPTVERNRCGEIGHPDS